MAPRMVGSGGQHRVDYLLSHRTMLLLHLLLSVATCGVWMLIGWPLMPLIMLGMRALLHPVVHRPPVQVPRPVLSGPIASRVHAQPHIARAAPMGRARHSSVNPNWPDHLSTRRMRLSWQK